MANPEHVKVAKEGKDAIEQWRKENPGVRLDLSQADMMQASLSLADLREADLQGTNLRSAVLVGANLSGADLQGANLFDAKLLAADLHSAKLQMSSLSLADFRGTSLEASTLGGADLTGVSFYLTKFAEADFKLARLALTVFGSCDLSSAKGLAEAVHESPSTIGVDTLIDTYRGAGNCLTSELETFFPNAGVPKGLLDALPQIVREVKYHSCFVCYGEPDRDFAERLVGGLRSKGVSCWLYSVDYTPGERTWQEINQNMREAERMIVLCSADSLKRDGALKEIEEGIDGDHDKIIPVSMDNLWKETGFKVMRGNRDLKPFLLERNYADFSIASAYDESLERLLRGLERKD